MFERAYLWNYLSDLNILCAIDSSIPEEGFRSREKKKANWKQRNSGLLKLKICRNIGVLGVKPMGNLKKLNNWFLMYENQRRNSEHILCLEKLHSIYTHVC